MGCMESEFPCPLDLVSLHPTNTKKQILKTPVENVRKTSNLDNDGHESC